MAGLTLGHNLNNGRVGSASEQLVEGGMSSQSVQDVVLVSPGNVVELIGRETEGEVSSLVQGRELASAAPAVSPPPLLSVSARIGRGWSEASVAANVATVAADLNGSLEGPATEQTHRRTMSLDESIELPPSSPVSPTVVAPSCLFVQADEALPALSGLFLAPPSTLHVRRLRLAVQPLHVPRRAPLQRRPVCRSTMGERV